MATPTLYDPSTEMTPPLPGVIFDPGSTNIGVACSITSLWDTTMPFSIGCILAGVVSNTTGQGQIYPTGRN